MSKSVRTISCTLAMSFLVTLLGPVSAAADQNPDAALPDALKGELQAVLQAKVAELGKDKNEDGVPFKRGYYSKSFKKVDDRTYLASFTRNTARKDSMLTERFELTLGKDPSGKWSVVKEEPRDSLELLKRGILGDEEFFRFDRLEFAREGLKITATNGTLYKNFFDGKTSQVFLTAQDLAYDFNPPRHAQEKFYQSNIHALGQYEALLRYNEKKYANDLIFKPESAFFECDGQSCEELVKEIFTGLSPITKDKADPFLVKKYNDAMDESRKELKENAFFGFRLPPEKERRFWYVRLRKPGTEHDIGLSFDNFDPKEVAFWADRLGTFETGYAPIVRYYAEATVKSGIDPYDLERRDDAETRDFDLEGMTGNIELALEDAEKVKADVTYTLKAKRETDTVRFFVITVRGFAEDKNQKKPRLTVDSIQDGSGQELTFVTTGGSSGLVVLPKKIPAAGEFSLRMQFQNAAGVYKLNPSFSYTPRGGWLPFVRFGDMIKKFDLTIKIPERYKVLGVGEKISEATDNGVNITRWVSPSPVTFPSITFGEYIEAKPRFPAKKLDGTEIPINIYVDKVSTTLVEKNVYASEGDIQDTIAQQDAGARGIRGSALQPLAEQAANAINLYTKLYEQDYPFAKLDLVADPLGAFYGQAPSSLIYLGFGLFYGEGKQAEIAGRDAAYLTRFSKSVVAHEVAHQWWGALVANANSGNYWFIETLAEVSSAIFVETVFGKKAYDEHVATWRRAVMNTDMGTNVQDASELAAADPGNYQVAVYNKGPYAFHVLRMTFGDEKFFLLLRTLAAKLKQEEVVSRDLQMVAEEVYGFPLETFFDQWIRGVGIPQYAVFYSTRQTEDGKWLVEGKIRQRVVVGRDKTPLEGVYYAGFVPMTVTTHEGKEYDSKPIPVRGPETPFQFKVAEQPASVEFNKRGFVLAHDILYNRSW